MERDTNQTIKKPKQPTNTKRRRLPNNVIKKEHAKKPGQINYNKKPKWGIKMESIKHRLNRKNRKQSRGKRNREQKRLYI